MNCPILHLGILISGVSNLASLSPTVAVDVVGGLPDDFSGAGPRPAPRLHRTLPRSQGEWGRQKTILWKGKKVVFKNVFICNILIRGTCNILSMWVGPSRAAFP